MTAHPSPEQRQAATTEHGEMNMTSEAERRVIEASIRSRTELWTLPASDYSSVTRAWCETVDALIAENAAALNQFPRPSPGAPADVEGLERKVAEANEVVADLVARHRDRTWPVDDSLKLTDALNARRVAKDEIAAARRPQGRC